MQGRRRGTDRSAQRWPVAGRFEGKVVLVTGASAGIGRAAAVAFAQEGARLVLGNRNVEAGEATAALARAAGGEALFRPTDVTHEAQVDALVAAGLDTYGRIDAAFNNAGAAIPKGGQTLTHQHTLDEWRWTLDVNLTGVWLCLRAEVRAMLEAGGGAIVNMSSIGGLVGSRAGGAAYTAAKHGVVGLTKLAAAEYAPQGIRVNAVCPGPILTDMWEPLLAANPKLEERVAARVPLHRMGTVDEVAQTVLWLCSDAASYVTGHAVPIDGGIAAT